MLKKKAIQILLIFFCLNLPAHSIIGQKVLQLERGGSARTTKIHIGENLEFKLKNDPAGWYNRTIFDIDPARGYINFEGVEIHVDSIAKLRFSPPPLVPKIIGTALQAGGANMIIFDISRSTIFDQDRKLDSSTWIAGAANIGVGTLIRKLFKYRKFKPGKRKRLRLLNIDFGPPVKPIT